MLAINDNNQVVSIKEKPSLTAVDLGTDALPKGLVTIKLMFGNKRYTPHFIYDSVLNAHQRAVLCYAAGLSRSDTTKAFNDFSDEQKLGLQKSVLLLDSIYKAFNKVNAISPAKFIAGAMPKIASDKGVLS